jgi:hypothetical protein
LNVLTSSKLRAAGRILAIAVFGFTSSCFASSLLINGSFEEIAVTGEPWYVRDFNSLPGWTQYADGVDLVHNNYLQGPAVLVDAQDGVQFLDMNGANQNGGIFQDVAVTIGNTYHLTLYTAGWATNGLDAQIAYDLYDVDSNTVLVSGSNLNNQGVWTQRELTAVATGNTLRVHIYNIYASQAGSGLDNVQLTDISEAPEPATFGLIGLGAIGILAARRRATR